MRVSTASVMSNNAAHIKKDAVAHTPPKEKASNSGDSDSAPTIRPAEKAGAQKTCELKKQNDCQTSDVERYHCATRTRNEIGGKKRNR